MHKLSLSNLRARFRSPLRISIFDKPQPKHVEVIPISEHKSDVISATMNSNFEGVKKEDALYSPYYIETISKFKAQNHPSSCVLQMGFCCQNPNTKLVAVNHTTELFDCFKDKCPRKLIKVTIGNWS